MKNKNPFFLTKSEAFRTAWFIYFAAKLSTYAALFGIPQAWVEEIVAASTLLQKMVKLLEDLRLAANRVVLFKDALFDPNPAYPNELVELKKFLVELKDDLSSLPNIFSRAISVAQIILVHPLATDIILKDLKLVKPTDTEATEASGKPRRPVVGNAPVLKAKVAGDVVTITIVRGKKFRGLMADVFVNRTDKDDIEFLGTTNTGTITDRAVFAEGVQLVTYTYQAQMMKGGTPIGDPSEPLIVVVQRPLGLKDPA